MPKVTDFELPSTGEKTFRLSKADTPIVLYFYPKDHTSGCTDESEQFRDLYKQFTKLGYHIYGISRDSIKSHEKFKEKLNLPFDLLSDEEEKVCIQFDVMKMKNMYGKKVRGIERSTFVIDGKGNISQEWRKVKVPGHAKEVLEFIKSV
jgi:peroxiredoxin Q/BCP